MITESGILIETPTTRMTDAIVKAQGLYDRGAIGLNTLASLMVKAERQCRDELRQRLPSAAAVKAYGMPHWEERQQLLAKSRAGLARFQAGQRTGLLVKRMAAGPLSYSTFACDIKAVDGEPGVSARFSPSRGGRSRPDRGDPGVPPGAARFEERSFPDVGDYDPEGDPPARGRTRLNDASADGGDGGGFVMLAAAFDGEPDRSGDIIEAGAFKNLSEFCSDGWIAVNHQNERLPVGMPMSADQPARGLVVNGIWHSTPEAQATRVVVEERKRAGKRVLCSIGYVILPDGFRMERRGGAMVRILTDLALYEASFVNLPANNRAEVLSAAGGGKGRRPGPGDLGPQDYFSDANDAHAERGYEGGYGFAG